MSNSEPIKMRLNVSGTPYPSSLTFSIPTSIGEVSIIKNGTIAAFKGEDASRIAAKIEKLQSLMGEGARLGKIDLDKGLFTRIITIEETTSKWFGKTTATSIETEELVSFENDDNAEARSALNSLIGAVNTTAAYRFQYKGSTEKKEAPSSDALEKAGLIKPEELIGGKIPLTRETESVALFNLAQAKEKKYNAPFSHQIIHTLDDPIEISHSFAPNAPVDKGQHWILWDEGKKGVCAFRLDFKNNSIHFYDPMGRSDRKGKITHFINHTLSRRFKTPPQIVHNLDNIQVGNGVKACPEHVKAKKEKQLRGESFAQIAQFLSRGTSNFVTFATTEADEAKRLDALKSSLTPPN